MDPRFFVVLIPIVAIIAGAVITVEKMRLGIKTGRGGAGADAMARIDALEHDLEHVRQELAETQERVDFTERLLAKQKDAGRVGPA